MVSFFLILVCCYLKALKYPWKLCSQLLLQACIAGVVKLVHLEHLFIAVVLLLGLCTYDKIRDCAGRQDVVSQIRSMHSTQCSALHHRDL